MILYPLLDDFWPFWTIFGSVIPKKMHPVGSNEIPVGRALLCYIFVQLSKLKRRSLDQFVDHSSENMHPTRSCRVPINRACSHLLQFYFYFVGNHVFRHSSPLKRNDTKFGAFLPKWTFRWEIEAWADNY